MAGVPSTYFVADDGSTGRELWRRLPNGEVERVADIAAGATSSDPGLYGGFVEFNGALYFRAADDGFTHRLYRVTSEGAVELVADAVDNTSDTSLTVFDGALYFTSAGPDGDELYRVTSSGTVETVADLVPGDSDPDNVIVYNGDLYFTAWDSTFSERFVYRLDDSVSVPALLGGLGGLLIQDSGEAIGLGNAIYFTAHDGSAGTELYKLDTLTGTVSLAGDVYPGPPSSFPHDFNIFNGALYFSAYDSTTFTNILYRLNTGGVVEAVPDAVGGVYDPGFNASGYVEFDGSLFFTAYVPSNGGYELCRVDSAGTIQLVDLDLGSVSDAAVSSGFTIFNGELYFSASTPATGFELYKLSSAGGTPTLVADLSMFGGSTPGQLGGFIEYNNALYFVADETSGKNLMRVTLTGAVETVADLPDAAFEIFNFAISGGDLYLTVTHPLSGRELYRLDADGNFGLAGDVNEELAITPQNPLPYANSVTVGGELYFTATTQATGTELWKVGPGGNFEQVDIRPGAESSDAGMLNGGLFSFNGDAYFGATNNLGEWQLFRLPAAGGMEQVTINPFGASVAGSGPGFFALGTSLYFMADDGGAAGVELWRVTAGQPSTPEFVFDFNADGSSSQAGAFGGGIVELGGALYIVAYSDAFVTRTFFKIEDDGVNPPAVTEVADVPPDAAIVSKFTAFNGDIYFTGADFSGTAGNELYRLNLSLPVPAVELVADLAMGPASSSPERFTVFDNALYFVATASGGDTELHRITAANGHLIPPVVEVLDTIEPGSNGSFPGNFSGFIVFDNALYFDAYDSTTGWELRRIPASSGIIETVDLTPTYAAGSSPQRYHIFNDYLYVVAGADDGAGFYIGTQLHRIPLTGSGDGIPELAADFGSGSGNPSIYSGFIEFDGSLYFTADGSLDAPAYGHHFYRIDPAGTVHYVATVPSGLLTYTIGVSPAGITFQEQGGDVYLLDALGNLIKGVGVVASNEATQGSDPAFVTEFDSNTPPEFVDDEDFPLAAITVPAFAENTVNAAAQPIMTGAPVMFAFDREGDWAGGTLTVGGLAGGDVLSLGNVTVDLPIGPIDVVISGTDVYVDGLLVGQYTLAGASFEVVFNAAANTQYVTAVLNAIHYASTSDSPDTNRNLTVTLGDSHGALTNLTLTIDVNAENDAPTPRGTLNLTVNEEGLGAGGSAATTDPDGDTLTYALQGGFAHGTVSVHPLTGAVTYTPTDLNFDTDVTFIVRATDPSGLFTDITVEVDVVPQPDDPIAADDGPGVDFVLPEDGFWIRNISTLLANDSDPDTGDTLTIEVGSATHGTVSLVLGNVVRFFPDPDYFGPASFTYTLRDQTGREDTATVFLDVTPVNDPPSAGDFSASTDEDTAVVIDVGPHVSDIDDTPFIFATVPAAQGTITSIVGNLITFTPAADFNGTANITYTAYDASFDSDQGAITVTVNPVNDAPVFTGLPQTTGLTREGFRTLTISNSPATEVSSGVYELTTADLWDAGAVWSEIDLSYSFTLDTQLYFGASDGADGIAFVIQSQGPDALQQLITAPGGNHGGAALGVGGFAPYGTAGLPNAFGIWMDTWDNFDLPAPRVDAAGRSIAFFENNAAGYTSLASGASVHTFAQPLENGLWHDLTVSWDAATHTLSYSFSHTSGETFSASQVFDPGALPAGPVQLGFSAATGTAVARQQVEMESFAYVMTEHTLGAAGSVAATDVEGDALTYSLVGPPGGFAIDSSTGVISVIDETALDYERELALGGDARIELTVRVTDPGGLFDETTVAIEVLDENPDDVHGTVRDEIIYGGALADTLRGDSGVDRLEGGLGNDTLTGGSGGDTFVRDANDASGAQSDVVTDFSVAEDKIDLGTLGPASFEAARNWLIRSTEADTTSLGDTRLLSAWNSNLQAMALTGVAAQWVNGQLVSTLSASNFVFDTSTTARTTAGTPGNDALFGGLGDDTLTGGAGADLMVGDAGNDSLSGNAGTDLLDGGAGADAFDGGADSDAVYYTTGGGVTLILGAPVAGVTAAIAGSSADALGDTFASIERIRGTAFADTITLNSAETVITGLSGYFGNDTLTGSAGANMISGGDGDDTLLSGGGNDALLGEAGNDSLTANGVYTIATLLGGSGNDTLTGGNGVDALQGQDGDDVINAGPGNDAAWGGANDDEIILSGSYTSGVAFGEAGEDTLTGGNGNDRLDGGADNDTLDGNEGNDILFGQSGADVVNGGGGNDLMYDADGMSGDAYTGGSGTDSLFYQTGGTFDFTAVGADSYDTSIEWVRFMAGAVTVTGTANADRFSGSTSGDTINAGGETDWLQGLGGGDVLNGEGGNDRIEGGVGSDTIRGGTGSDQLTGGNTGSTAGDGAADTFLYTVTDIGAVDRINDFEAGLDKIGLDAASFGFAAGPLAANRFMTLAAYSGGAANAISGDVFAYNAANGYLYWDADGATAGGLAVMTIFSNTANLTAGDFVLI